MTDHVHVTCVGACCFFPPQQQLAADEPDRKGFDETG